MEATHDDVRFAVDAPSDGVIDAAISACTTIYAERVQIVSIDVHVELEGVNRYGKGAQRRRETAGR